MAGLFGSTTPLAPEILRHRYGTEASYVAAYARATDAAIAAGFLLAEDRDAVVVEGRNAMPAGVFDEV